MSAKLRRGGGFGLIAEEPNAAARVKSSRLLARHGHSCLALETSGWMGSPFHVRVEPFDHRLRMVGQIVVAVPATSRALNPEQLFVLDRNVVKIC
jgi:hypothetical protein